MVDSITCLGRNGLSTWLLQRVSALVLGGYTLFLVCFFGSHSGFSYIDWYSFFANPWMKIISLIAMLNIVAHAWIGIWTVITDYVKCSCLRLTLEVALILGLLGLMLWGLMIFLVI